MTAPGILLFICKMYGELHGESSGCSARKNEITLADRKPDFGGAYLSAEALYQFNVHEIREYRRLESCGIGINKEEQRFFLEYFAGEFQEWME